MTNILSLKTLDNLLLQSISEMKLNRILNPNETDIYKQVKFYNIYKYL